MESKYCMTSIAQVEFFHGNPQSARNIVTRAVFELHEFADRDGMAPDGREIFCEYDTIRMSYRLTLQGHANES